MPFLGVVGLSNPSARTDRRSRSCAASRTRPHASPPGRQRDRGTVSPTGDDEKEEGGDGPAPAPARAGYTVPVYNDSGLYFVLKHQSPPQSGSRKTGLVYPPFAGLKSRTRPICANFAARPGSGPCGSRRPRINPPPVNVVHLHHTAGCRTSPARTGLPRDIGSPVQVLQPDGRRGCRKSDR